MVVIAVWKNSKMRASIICSLCRCDERLFRSQKEEWHDESSHRKLKRQFISGIFDTETSPLLIVHNYIFITLLDAYVC